MELRFSIAICMIPVIVGALPILSSMLVWRLTRSGKPIWLCLLLAIIGIFILLVFGPLFINDKIIASERGIYQHTGFWWAPQERGFSLAGVKEIQIEVQNKDWSFTVGHIPVKNFKVRNEIWHILYAKGTDIPFDPGDLWDLHSAEIKNYIESQGVTVRKMTPGK